mmetsp:Transcript_8244/g.21209  ORF Transcript_8244/g.21209 Transcript_8244/m.21209 type:complete len:88 (+) Transcript_8244:445-708(+)
MLGMNAEMIQNAFLALINLLDKMTYGMAELTGCTPPQQYKLQVAAAPTHRRTDASTFVSDADHTRSQGPRAITWRWCRFPPRRWRLS